MTARFLIVALCAVIASAGAAVALGDDDEGDTVTPDPIELRKDDSSGAVELIDDEDDDDPTGDRDKTPGDDGTNAGHNHDRDGTGGDDGTQGGDNSVADGTRGDDGTGGGDNSGVVPAAPAPPPAPVYDDYSDDAGVAYSAS